VDEDLMNGVASSPRTLQPYLMDTTEVKKKVEKWRKNLLFQENVRELPVFLYINRCSMCLVHVLFTTTTSENYDWKAVFFNRYVLQIFYLVWIIYVS